MELMVYSEMKWLFNKTEVRKKIFDMEIDVFIPELPLAIEIDGSYWHKNKRKKDLQKNIVMIH